MADAVNDGAGAVRLAAAWAVLGKHPGRSMGYEVLAGSLPGDRAQRYLWSATTGTPDARDPAGGLPWRVFLCGADNEAGSVCAVVDTTWDGAKDGTGAASYTWRLLLLEWRPASRAGLTWTSLDRAVSRAEHAAGRADVTVDAVRTTATELADTVDELGFPWAAGVAALLLDGRQVVITPPSGGVLPDVGERVRILDAVCSLLPYGCRVWLSGATWTGKAEHQLRLVLGAYARTGQQQATLRTGRPPAPQGDAARTYLAELLRVRAKRESTAEVVAHLLAATGALPLGEPDEAVRILRELDLLDSVLSAVRQGRGQVDDVRRLLELHAATTLPEQPLRVLMVFLAQCALRMDQGAARELLTRHWTPLVPEFLAADVVARPASKETFALARRYLDLLHGPVGPGPEAFDRLFTALVTTPGYDPSWVGSLAYMVENEFGYTSEVADRILVGTREAGQAWLDGLLKNRSRDFRPLARLVALTATPGAGRGPGWLRFAGVLTGHFGPADADEADAADFAAGHEDAWRIALESARDRGQPGVVGPLWPVLRQAVLGGGQREVLRLLDAVAPPGTPGLPPEAAADADLLGILARPGGADAPSGPSMPRLRRLTAQGAVLDAYTTAVVRRAEGDPGLRDRVIGALLGAEPDPGHCWAVLTRWMRQRPSTEAVVQAELARRLTSADYSRWLDLDLSEDLMDGLDRGGLGWLRPVRRLRRALNDRVELTEVSRIIAEACPGRSIPDPLLDEIASFMSRLGPPFAFRLTTELDRQRQGLGIAVYEVLGRSARHRALREQLIRFSTQEEIRHHRIIGALSAVPPAPYGDRPHADPRTAPMPPSPPPQVPAPSGYPPVSPPYEEESRSWGLFDKVRHWGRS
ncbi:hypothetical protein [Streptomyces sp. NPDC056154]|uniref:hypothetical protein n=1 Tax=unclassified Streptomyces TaxID=2593676 RepID=UPI0035DB857D